jgi:hypothetical protein
MYEPNSEAFEFFREVKKVVADIGIGFQYEYTPLRKTGNDKPWLNGVEASGFQDAGVNKDWAAQHRQQFQEAQDKYPSPREGSRQRASSKSAHPWRGIWGGL